MPESRDDARDDLTILMPADQDVRFCSPIAYRDHELLRMPKRKNDMPSLTIQGIHLFVALRVHLHRSPQASNHRSPDRRKHRELQPLLDSFLHAFSSSTLITHHRSHITLILRIGHIQELHGMEALVLASALKQFVVRADFDD